MRGSLRLRSFPASLSGFFEVYRFARRLAIVKINEPKSRLVTSELSRYVFCDRYFGARDSGWDLVAPFPSE